MNQLTLQPKNIGINCRKTNKETNSQIIDDDDGDDNGTEVLKAIKSKAKAYGCSRNTNYIPLRSLVMCSWPEECVEESHSAFTDQTMC